MDTCQECKTEIYGDVHGALKEGGSADATCERCWRRLEKVGACGHHCRWGRTACCLCRRGGRPGVACEACKRRANE